MGGDGWAGESSPLGGVDERDLGWYSLVVAKLSDFPFSKTRDLRGAMANGLATYLAAQSFAFPRGTVPVRFAEVYDRWASFNDLAVGDGKLPAAAVLIDRVTYGEEIATPQILDRTWTGGDPTLCDERGRKEYPYGDGTGVGHALVEMSEVSAEIVVTIRALSYQMRRAILAGLEERFIEAGNLLDPAALDPDIDPNIAVVPRYGVRLKLDDYYGRSCLYMLKATVAPESERASKENRWEALLEIQASLTACGVVPLRGMVPSVKVEVDGEAGDEA